MDSLPHKSRNKFNSNIWWMKRGQDIKISYGAGNLTHRLAQLPIRINKTFANIKGCLCGQIGRALDSISLPP